MAKIRRRIKHLPTEHGGKKSQRSNITKSRAWKTAKCTNGSMNKSHRERMKAIECASVNPCDLVRRDPVTTHMIPNGMTAEQYLLTLV